MSNRTSTPTVDTRATVWLLPLGSLWPLVGALVAYGSPFNLALTLISGVVLATA